MKKYFIYITVLAGLLAACKKDSTRAFGESADTRVGKTLTAFQKTLADSENGWKTFIYPKAGSGFSFWMKFDNANRVTMISDFNQTTATTPKSSSYRLKALQQPTLMFDTYNYIHLPADPTSSISGGPSTGTGLSSDFEFMLLEGLIDSLNKDLPPNELSLTGRFNGVSIKFVKATQAEATAYNASGLDALMTQVKAYIAANRYLFVKLGDDKRLQVSVDPSRKSFSLAWETDGVVSTSNSPFAFTLTGMLLQKPVEYKGKKFSELFWDDANQLLYTMVDGVKVVIEVASSPVLLLHLVLGTSGFSTIAVPAATTFPGWSDDFIARRANAAAAILAGSYRLTMGEMVFKFSASLKTLVIETDIFQGATRFLATFSYTYTKTQAGLLKFTPGDPAANANGGLIIASMAPLLAQRLNADQFSLDYFMDPVAGILGQLISVEHPDFTFTGKLQ